MTKHFTPKQHVLMAEPTATLDFYECLRGAGDPCWFIRTGLQGTPLSVVCASPRAAWAWAYKALLQSLRRTA